MEIRVSVEEKSAWAEAAKCEGVSLSDWIRGRLNERVTLPSKQVESVKIVAKPKPRPTVKESLIVQPEVRPTMNDKPIKDQNGITEQLRNGVWVDRTGRGLECGECKVVEGEKHKPWCGTGNRLTAQAKEELNGRA